MRTALLFLLGLPLCHIAAAQVPEVTPASPSTESMAGAQATPATVPLAANTLYMCEFQSNSQLFKVNTINGQVTAVGPMQTNERCTDLAFRQTKTAGTELFGTSFTRAFKIDPTTGKATLLPNAYGSGFTDINALVAQRGTGKLYGAGFHPPGQVVEISPTTGKATKRGNYGPGLSSSGDLEFLNGQLYGLLYKSGSGAQTFLAKISLSPSTFGKATNLLPIRRKINGHLVPQNDVWGLALRNGVLYGAMRSGELITIDPATGIAILKGDNHKVQAGLAVSP